MDWGLVGACTFFLDQVAYYMDLDLRKPVFWGLQTTRPQTSLRSLISFFVIPSLNSIIFAIRDVSIFQLVSVAVQADCAWPEWTKKKSTPHTRYVVPKKRFNSSAEFLKWNHPVDYIDSSSIANDKYFAAQTNK